MSNAEKREIAVPKYFITTPEAPKEANISLFLLLLMIAGIMFILVGLTDFGGKGWLLCLGVPAVFFTGSLIFAESQGEQARRSHYDEVYKKAEPKPSDEQMDKWLSNDLKRIRKESLAKLDLLPEQVLGNPDAPIMVVGPSSGAHVALGKDNIIRFSSNDVVVLYLTDYHLAAYSCTSDLASGLDTKESTQEYHYTDVVSVATRADNSRTFKVVVDGKDKPLAQSQKFSLSVASGEKIEVVISLPQLDDIIENGRLAPTGAENAVKLIRSRLREKKGGIHE